MRWLLLLLVFLNVTYWLAHLDAPTGKVVPVAPPAKVPAIELLSEVATGQAASIEPDENVERCYTLGPFSTLVDAQRVAAALMDAGAVESVVRNPQSGVSNEYWVYLPPFPSRDEAIAVARGLADRGFRDYFIVPDGDRRNALSLGVFSTIERAQERQRQIKSLGREALIEARPKGKAEFSVEYRIRAEMESRVGKIGLGADIVRRQETQCPTGG